MNGHAGIPFCRCNYSETLTKTFIIPARQNQFIQENIFNKAPVRWIAIAMNTNSAFIRSYTKIQSGVNNLISDKSEYSEVISQL